MKTINMIGLLLILAVSNLKAQIPNPGFENLNADGSIQHWGITFILSAWVDTDGVFHTDSIVVDQSYCATTTDAHSGLRAVEMRNAYNYTQSAGIAGGAISSSDTMFSTYSAFVDIQNRPDAMNFYYKNFPVNDDTASAEIDLYDAGLHKIGSGALYFSDLVSNYTYASVPITYSSTDTAYLMQIRFKASSRGINAQFGSRFLVDDVEFAAPTKIDDYSSNHMITVAPNPSQYYISIRSEIPVQSTSLISMNGKQVFSVQGEQRMIDCSRFAEGIYVLRLETSKGIITKSIVIKH